MLRITPERAILLALLVFSVLSITFMDQLVAAPKLLLGRMLTAISPSLFPTIMISLLGTLCALVLLLTFFGKKEVALTDHKATPIDWMAVRRAVLLFACMLFYAVTMQPFGFFISSALTLAMISVLTGNRSKVQIGVLAIAAPIILYLIATRVLHVSLPELNTIELFYAHLINSAGAYL